MKWEANKICTTIIQDAKNVSNQFCLMKTLMVAPKKQKQKPMKMGLELIGAKQYSFFQKFIKVKFLRMSTQLRDMVFLVLSHLKTCAYIHNSCFFICLSFASTLLTNPYSSTPQSLTIFFKDWSSFILFSFFLHQCIKFHFSKAWRR